MQITKSPWAVPKDDLLKLLGTRPEGLSENEAESRLKVYGTNAFHSHEKRNSAYLFFKQFLSPLIFLLLGASILTSFLHEWINTSVIAFSLLLNICLGFYHEYRAENTLEKLTTYIKDLARVIRDNREEEVESSSVVPGDILKLSYGMRIPADARILSVNNFQVDEAILTGESVPVSKIEEASPLSIPVSDRKNIAHAGTLVVGGYATAVAYATGDSTEIGKIAKIVSATKRSKTPLQKAVSNLAWLVFAITLVIIFAIFILGISRGEPLVPMLILSTAVAVGAVPEALPITLTVILAIGSLKIADKKGIIRQLSAAETLGSTTLIMTDKTGTLTMADMQLVGIYTLESIISKKNKENEFSKEQKKLLEYGLSNIDVTVENREKDKKNWIFKGKPFEVNIAKAARDHGVPLESILSVESSLVLPFNSTNKFSISFKDGEHVVMGAPDVLLKKSNLSKEKYLKLIDWVENTSSEGKRIIGLATYKNPISDKHVSPEQVANLDFAGALVFYDPIRPEVPKAINLIESHGIKIVLVTGDLKGTALTVAKSLGWQVKENEILTGPDLHSMSDEDLSAVISKVKIFARVTPEDKLRIGKIYQKKGDVVAMTGDGVNDAPALKAMDIGISLGSGSDVAKSAADLVLLNDNFETISLAIDEGHRILSNIRKTVVYLMSNSLDEVFVVGGSLIMGLALPISALQIIWVNLFTGSLPALAFAFDENMDRKKYSKKESKSIFNKEVKIIAFGIGILSSVLIFILYNFLLKYAGDIGQVRSIFFTCFASYILVVSFSLRSLNHSLLSFPVFSNMKLNLSILIALAILIITITVPFMREIFELDPLPIQSLPLIFSWLLLNVLLVEGAKFLLRRKSSN